MSEVDEKLIVRFGQRISEKNEILRMIAASGWKKQANGTTLSE